MREFKFRAWDVFNKEMVYDLVDIYASYIDNKHIGPWMQFTGLKDKEGEDIYEGDILKIKYYDGRTLKIRYEEVKIDKYDCEEYGSYIGYQNYEELTYCKVVGNIYENKEMIK